MAFPKQIKDIVYKLLQEPTLDNFREFLQNQTGEHNAIDFKREWICKDKLAKLMLALANYGGGVVVFGVQENDDKTFSCEGLQSLHAISQPILNMRYMILLINPLNMRHSTGKISRC